MMNVIIFGPPGIGKTTTIERIAQYIGDDFAVDLEREDLRELLALMGWNWMFCEGRMGNLSVIGGADLNPRRQYPNTIKVVLTMDQKEYERRRASRDQREPHKALQPPQLISQWLGIKDAVYINADQDAVTRILALREVKANGNSR